MLELKIFSPQENGFVPEIKWNNEELKTAIAEKMEEYKGLVFTEETISEGKKDRANLNKLQITGSVGCHIGELKESKWHRKKNFELQPIAEVCLLQLMRMEA